MKTISHLLVLAIAALGAGAGRPVAAQTAAAYILEDVDIDGDLDDWPEDMPSYPIATKTAAYGATDIEHADLATSTDLSPRFKMGYDPDEDLVYLAVEVRDDAKWTGNGYAATDACEVYVSGLSGRNPLQYVMIPGKGSYGPGYDGNPGLYRGSMRNTRTRGAFQRRGDVTVYEWAIEVFDRYPDRPTDLEAGGTIGFDVVVVDKDATGATAWVPWGPALSRKYDGDDRIGRMVLSHMSAEDMAELRAELGELGAEVREVVREIFDESPELATEAQALAVAVQALAAEAQALAVEHMAHRASRAGERHRETAQKHARLAERMAERITRRIIIDGDRVKLKGLDVVIPPMPGIPAMPPLPPELLALETYGAALNRGESIAGRVIDGLIAVGVILAIGLSVGVSIFLIRRSGRRRPMDEEGMDDLTERLETIARRLTDTQEVMLALSERYDELEGRQPSRTDREQDRDRSADRPE